MVMIVTVFRNVVIRDVRIPQLLPPARFPRDLN